MKVFVVIECGHYSVNNLLCNALGVHTTLEQAKIEMLACHKTAVESVNLIDKELVSNISTEIDEMECTIVYKNKVANMTERHFVFIEERELEN